MDRRLEDAKALAKMKGRHSAKDWALVETLAGVKAKAAPKVKRARKVKVAAAAPKPATKPAPVKKATAKDLAAD